MAHQELLIERRHASQQNDILGVEQRLRHRASQKRRLFSKGIACHAGQSPAVRQRGKLKSSWNGIEGLISVDTGKLK